MDKNLDPAEVFEALQEAEAFGLAESDGGRMNGPVREFIFFVHGRFNWGDIHFVTGTYMVTCDNQRAIAYTTPGEEG